MRATRGRTWAALAVLVGALAGCGGGVKQVPTLPDTLAVTEAKILLAATQVSGALQESAKLLQVALAASEDIMAAANLPAAVRTQVRAGFIRVAERGQAVNRDVMSGTAKTWAQLKSKVDPFTTEINALLAQVSALTVPQKRSIGEWVGAILSIAIIALDIIAKAQGV
jgi:hypothetical protein